MSEQVPVWADVFSAIDTELTAVLNTAGDAAFVDVIQGEPIGLPLGGPYVCFWYLGRTDASAGKLTLGNVMYAARIQILCLWPMQAERATLGAWEADIATIDTSIRRRFRANSVINSNLTDLDIGDSQLGYADLPIASGSNTRGLYRVLSMELQLDNLEGEAISA